MIRNQTFTNGVNYLQLKKHFLIFRFLNKQTLLYETQEDTCGYIFFCCNNPYAERL